MSNSNMPPRNDSRILLLERLETRSLLAAGLGLDLDFGEFTRGGSNHRTFHEASTQREVSSFSENSQKIRSGERPQLPSLSHRHAELDRLAADLHRVSHHVAERVRNTPERSRDLSSSPLESRNQNQPSQSQSGPKSNELTTVADNVLEVTWVLELSYIPTYSASGTDIEVFQANIPHATEHQNHSTAHLFTGASNWLGSAAAGSERASSNETSRDTSSNNPSPTRNSANATAAPASSDRGGEQRNVDRSPVMDRNGASLSNMMLPGSDVAGTIHASTASPNEVYDTNMLNAASLFQSAAMETAAGQSGTIDWLPPWNASSEDFSETALEETWELDEETLRQLRKLADTASPSQTGDSSSSPGQPLADSATESETLDAIIANWFGSKTGLIDNIRVQSSLPTISPAGMATLSPQMVDIALDATVGVHRTIGVLAVEDDSESGLDTDQIREAVLTAIELETQLLAQPALDTRPLRFSGLTAPGIAIVAGTLAIQARRRRPDMLLASR
ncbi:hypothetical protein LOC71_11265 [Rhodopirellula sp. JC740]|uniref:Uncharacterized protein n=1 Tax=Rhodopirellula halodulae TaxID=2894198 RepID=A0ABS8NH25_9BACT|nr:hypothetical protein [Rhodopirellula sp. JC740]MCC9642856.1 hypothetical protein [Rhodopirellula sp. JC740]